MAPDCVPAELLLVGLDPLGDEAPAAVAALERGDDLGRRVVLEGLGQLSVGLCLLLHLPQRADRVPVAIVGAVLQPAQQRIVDPAVRLLHHRPQPQRCRQLGEVEHPVDLPVAVVDVDRVLEQHGQLGQRHLRFVIQARLEIVEVVLHLGHQPVAPPVGEVLAVDRQRRVEVLAHAAGVGRVERHARAVARAVLHRVDLPIRIGRHGRRVQVAVDVLDDPVGREGRAEAAEHVVARQPPATDLLEHRTQRVRAVQVVEDPEEVLLALRAPLDRKRLVAQELVEDLVRALRDTFHR